MRTVASEDEQRRLDLLGPLHDHLERLADQDLRLEGNVGEFLSHDLGALEIRLAQLEESLVNDVVVQLLLLLELEHLRGLVGQHVLDVVEHDVVVFHVEGTAHVQRAAERLRQLERGLHRHVAVGRPVHAYQEATAGQGPIVADEEHVLLDAPQRARHHAAQLRERLPAQAVRTEGDEIVTAPGAADEPGCGVFVLRDEAAVGADLHVAAPLGAAVVARGPVRVEPDQPREPARSPVHLVDDLLVVDALEQLPGEGDAGGLAFLAQLVQEAVGDELQAFLDQLVVDLALALDLCGCLELRGEAGLELAEADVVEAGGVDVVAGDAAAGLATDLDGPLERPIGVLGVVDGNEDLAVHRHLLGDVPSTHSAPAKPGRGSVPMGNDYLKESRVYTRQPRRTDPPKISMPRPSVREYGPQGAACQARPAPVPLHDRARLRSSTTSSSLVGEKSSYTSPT